MRLGVVLVVVLLALLVGFLSFGSLFLDIQWWQEIGQIDVFWTRLSLQSIPVSAGTLLAFATVWIAHARALKAAGTGLGQHRNYSRVSTLVLLGLAFLLSVAMVDSAATIGYFAGSGTGSPAGFSDHAFGQSLSFYVFELPFYRMLLNYVMALAIATGVVYWLAFRMWDVYERLDMREGSQVAIDMRDLQVQDAVRLPVVRVVLGLALLLFALKLVLLRYELVYEDHTFLTGIDYVSQNFTNPIYLLRAGLAVVAALLLFAKQIRFAVISFVLVFVPTLIPPVVGIFVRPNEITLERPYIERHLQSTRRAYAMGPQRLREINAPITNQAVNVRANQTAFDNIRLWDWNAFHDAVTQIQTLRQYYAFADTDVDRYVVNGQLKQVLLSARELDITQLPDAQRRWLNPRLIYTHGYGLVMADAAQFTPDGQPVMYVQDAPARVKPPELKLTRPQLYFGERTHEPIFVNTKQEEFDYPQGDQNVHTRYAGKGGIPMTALVRLAAASAYLDRNILLTGYLQDSSRLMIRRDIRDRLQTIAPFLAWDEDPYIVLTNEGRLMWVVDGYTHTGRYPNSQYVRTRSMGRVNYVRNSVKATIDAYDGTTRLYVTEPDDPLVKAWQRLFPKLFTPLSAMSADLQSHLRHPETLFKIQAEIFRTFHMKDPEAFYNKEDVWEISGSISGQEATQQRSEPLYILAKLPGETKAEFLLLLPFSPRSKDNLIGLMVARCDGPKRGEIIVYELSKQSLVFGPMQIEARINQDQNISKDLSLWNQQGSRVLRGQMVTLPVEGSIVYIKPIYLQAAQARMPQLRKVAIATGDQLVYEDTYQQALLRLTGQEAALPAATTTTEQSATPTTAIQAPVVNDLLRQIRTRLEAYRRLMSEGRYGEAGRELEAAESLTKQK